MERRLATILAADVAGYSRLMEQAEEATAVQLEACQHLISDAVNSLGGRVFNRAGDAAFAEFASPINAIRSAVAIREQLADQDFNEDQTLKLRIGLHLADVLVAGDDLLGDGINLAARIQQAAQPDAICVSQVLFDQIKRHSPVSFEDIGEQRFKNISEPIRVYQVKGLMPNHRLQSAPTVPVGAASSIFEPNSVAVLPFAAKGADEDQQYLAEGLTEEIIQELARFRKLHVTSRSASFVYADKTVDPSQVARELRVAYVLEGQVRRLGSKVRLSLELISGKTGAAIWVNRLTQEFDDLFDLMETVTTEVAATILGRVESDAIETARRKRPESMSAYDFMLRGLDQHRAGCITHENSRQAVAWFDQAIEADPTYGPAYAWRICASSWLPEFDLEKERHFIDRALELDANNPEAQRIMGVVQMIKGDFEASRYHHERAMELSPNDAYLMARSASFYTYNEQPDRAMELIEKAMKLDPLLPVWCVEERGVSLFAAGKYQEAINALNELPFQSYRSRLYQCAALMAIGKTEDAKRAMHQALVTNKELTATWFMRKECWRDLNKRHQIRATLIEAGLPR